MEDGPDDDYDWEWIKYVYDNLPLTKILNINQLLVQDIDEIKQPIKYTIEQDGKEKEIINLNINNARVLEYYNDPIEITTNGDKTFDVGEEELDMPVMQYNFKVNVPSNLETWNNKRFTSNISTTISNLMADSTKNGVDKDSRITIDVPELQVTQISNYSITNNGTQNIPIPSGYDAVDSISVNVNVDYSNRILGYYNWTPSQLPEAITIASYNIANNTNYLGFNTIYCNYTPVAPTIAKIKIRYVKSGDTIVPLNNLRLQSGSGNLQVLSGHAIFYIYKYGDIWYSYLRGFSSNNHIYFNAGYDYYYCIFSYSNLLSVVLCDENQNYVCRFYDSNTSDSNSSQLLLYSNYYDINIPPN